MIMQGYRGRLRGLGRGAYPGATFAATGATSTVPTVRTPAVYMGSSLYGGAAAPAKTVTTMRQPASSIALKSTAPATRPVVTVPAPYSGTIAPSATTPQVSVTTTNYMPLLLIGGAVVLVIVLMSGGGK